MRLRLIHRRIAVTSGNHEEKGRQKKPAYAQMLLKKSMPNVRNTPMWNSVISCLAELVGSRRGSIRLHSWVHLVALWRDFAKDCFHPQPTMVVAEERKPDG